MRTQGFVDLALRLQKAGDHYCIHEVKQGLTSKAPVEDVLRLLPEDNAAKFSSHLTSQEAKAHARELFSILFQYETLQGFIWARNLAFSAGSTLRVQLHLEEAEELDNLPWELIAGALPEIPGDASLLRCISSTRPKQEAATSPLRVLAIFSSPTDLPRFDTELERSELERSLHDLTEEGRVSLECSDDASEAGLRRLLAQGEFQALHFVGYGRSNLLARHGSLIMKDLAGRSRVMTADHLYGLLGERSELRWAILSKGNNEGEANPFAQSARILVHRGLGAVIAMRRRIGGTARNDFNRHFYTSAVSGQSLEQSVLNARKILSQTSEASWAIPMLYLASSEIESSAEGSRNRNTVASNATPQRRPRREPNERKPAAPQSRRNQRKKILVLTASPENLTQLRLSEELREIDAGLRRAKYRQRFQLEHRPAVRPLDLQQAMLDIEPQIVHFCGHGAGADGLVLEDNNGLSLPVPSAALANLFRLFSDRVECVVLNSCHTEHQAQAISEHIRYVVGMKKEIEDRAAINFAVGFYCALGAGHSIDFAYHIGRSAIELENLPDHLIPILLAS